MSSFIEFGLSCTVVAKTVSSCIHCQTTRIVLHSRYHSHHKYSWTMYLLVWLDTSYCWPFRGHIFYPSMVETLQHSLIPYKLRSTNRISVLVVVGVCGFLILIMIFFLPMPTSCCHHWRPTWTNAIVTVKGIVDEALLCFLGNTIESVGNWCSHIIKLEGCGLNSKHCGELGNLGGCITAYSQW